jgi:hypothetical protein
MDWIEGVHWIRHTFRGKQLYLSDLFDYRFYAEQMGYGYLNLSEIPAIRIRLIFGSKDTLGNWIQAHPQYQYPHGFSDPDQIGCYASIHFSKIQEWCKSQGGIVSSFEVIQS